jgi:hypothetical protein
LSERIRFDVFILAGAVLILSISYYVGMVAIPQELDTVGILAISIGALACCILLGWWVQTRQMQKATGYRLNRRDAVILLGAITIAAAVLPVSAGIPLLGRMDPRVLFLFAIPFFAMLIVLVATIELVLRLMGLDQLDQDISSSSPLIEPHVSRMLDERQKQMIWLYKHRRGAKRFGRAFVIAGVLAQLIMLFLQVMGVNLPYLATDLSFLIVLEGCILLASAYSVEHPNTDGRIGWAFLVVLCSAMALLFYVEPIYGMNPLIETILLFALFDLLALIIAAFLFQAFFREDAKTVSPQAPQILPA